jgi:GNAT superfamily N-acetyltransferase
VNPAEIAEDLMAYLPGAGIEREWSHGGCLSYQRGSTPFFANVSAVRAGDAAGVDSLARHAAEWFGGRGRTDCFWFVTPSATPAAAVSELTALGLAEAEHGTAMTMSSPPPPGPDGVDIREAQSVDDFLAYRLLTLEAGSARGVDEAQRAATVADHPQAWRDLRLMGRRRRCYLAYVDGRPLAAGGLLFTDHDAACLAGGVTAPEARGHGLYRALVRHRWEVAAAEGVPALVVQASDDSQPILSRLGFGKVADIALLRQAF